MANLSFPSNPTNGQKVTIGTRVFEYNSTTERWSSRILQVLGDTAIVVTNEAPTITASLSEIALDTTGANVSFTYTVSDVDSSVLKVSHIVSGIANSDLATVTHHRANNTVTITAGTEEFSSANVVLTVTDGRNNASVSIDVSAVYGYVIPTDFSTQTLLSSYGSGTSNGGFLSLSADGTQGCIVKQGTTDETFKLDFATPFDSSTLTVTQITQAGLSNYGVYSAQFSRDGLHLLTSDGGPNIVNHTLSTPFDFSSRTASQSFSTQYSGSRAVAWAADGLGFIFRNSLNGDVWYYTPLSTAYDFTSKGTTTSAAISGTGNSNPATAAHNAWISSDGSYLIYNNSSGFVKIDLATPYDFSTATVGSVQAFNATEIGGSNLSWAPSFDGSKIVVSSSTIIKTFSL
jgi:hypothetical protein